MRAADTIATKPAFRDALRARRCILPASGFYEWSAGPGGEGLPRPVTRSDAAPLAFAAIPPAGGQQPDHLRPRDDRGRAGMAPTHHREPVRAGPCALAALAGECRAGAARLMQASGVGGLSAVRIGTAVNSSRASGPDLIEALPA
ncbi:MAG: SOS response-associated peptidase family protein [Pseudorhodobacter sp.]